MKVLVKEDAMQLHSKSIPAHMGYTTEQFAYRDKLREVVGKWLEVERENEYSYRCISLDGSSIDIDKRYIEEVQN